MQLKKQAESAFYDQWFSGFSYANLLQLERAKSILEALLVTGVSEPKIIDLGCGPGWLSNILGTFGPTVGVDLSGDAVRAASSRYSTAKYEAVDIFDWDYPRSSFDVVVSQEVIEHVEDQPRYLEIAYELLRPGGYLILTTPNSKAMMALSPAKRTEWTNQPLENWLTREQFRALLGKKFRIIRLTTIVQGMGTKGSHRLMNSPRFQSFLEALGLGRIFGMLYFRLGYGLHILAVGRKP